MKLTMQRSISPNILAALLSTAVLFLTSGARAQLVPVFDHLKCYVIKDPLKVKHTLDLTPEQTQFLPEPGCLLKSPAKLFCIDVQKTNVQPTPGGPPVQAEDARDYLCYIVHCPNVNQNKVLTVFDQFGQRDITIKPPKLLCAPAQKVGVPPKPTPTPCGPPNQPTPTVTPTPRACGIDPTAPQCSGDCPDPTLPKCLFTGNAAMPCACVPANQMCMDNGGTCSGLCPGLPGQPMSQCGSGPTGCQCLP